MEPGVSDRRATIDCVGAGLTIISEGLYPCLLLFEGWGFLGTGLSHEILLKGIQGNYLYLWMNC